MANIPSFTVAPHLAEYNAPLAKFTASNSQFTDFVVGGLVFSQSYPSSSSRATEKAPTSHRLRVLLLQRAETDSYPGYWEGPGGMCEGTDGTLLAGVAREVFEESGLRVSRFVDLVAVDEWERVLRGEVHRAAKFTFLVEVYEAEGDTGRVPSAEVEVGVARERWEDGVRLEQTEHQAFVWATEEEVRESVQGEGKYKFMGNQGRNLLRAFEMSARPSFV